MAGNDTSRYDDFDALAARHQGLIKRLCWWHAGGKADAVADLMQEVMLHLWRYRHTLRSDAGELQEKAWVWIRCRSVFSILDTDGLEQLPSEQHARFTTSCSSPRTLQSTRLSSCRCGSSMYQPAEAGQHNIIIINTLPLEISSNINEKDSTFGPDGSDGSFGPAGADFGGQLPVQHASGPHGVD